MAANKFLIQLTGIITFIIILKFLLLPFDKLSKSIFFFGFVFLCGSIFAFPLGQSGTPLLLLGSLAILYFSSNRLYNMAFFLISWIWSLFTDYAITIPLRLLGFDFTTIYNSLSLTLIFIVSHALLAIIPSYFAGKWMHRKFSTSKDFVSVQIQRLLFFEITVCSCIFLLNIIYGNQYNYPTEILLFNGILIFFFAIANFLIFLCLYRTLQENKRLALKTQAQENLAEYTEKLESHYQEIRRFKHDYMNILATITGYIQANDMEKLKDYFDLRIVPSSRLLENKDAIIAKLSQIKVLEIKGLLYTKLVQAMNLDLNITLELTHEITSVNMNLLVLCRVLGIYLDNAMEAAVLTRERCLHIALVKKDDTIIFHIENSTQPLPFPLDRLSAPGITTKEKHSGLGLATVRELLDATPNVQSFTTCEEGHIKQVLIISGGTQ